MTEVDMSEVLAAEATLLELSSIFAGSADNPWAFELLDEPVNAETRYKTLIEQIPAVVFLVYLDRAIGEAYLSPQIETLLGFSRAEWLEDPVRWYQHIHPEDKQRWSLEAADMFLTGKPVRSVYRVLSRDQRTIWFHCDAKMVRRDDGRPWFIQGVAFDITELKRAEVALQEQNQFVSAVLDTVGALVIVLDPEGRIIRLNRACERVMGYVTGEVKSKTLGEVFLTPSRAAEFRKDLAQSGSRSASGPRTFECSLTTRQGESRLIVWESETLPGQIYGDYTIAAGIDITESKRLEKTIVEIGEREQRRIGQELHDGLGQHLTGIAFMGKVLQERLQERNLPEAEEAAKILRLVNEAIQKTKQLSRGLLPVVNVSHGLMAALEGWTAEVQDLFQISCEFDCDDPVLVPLEAAANQLYLIAREAVMNSVRHGKASRIEISLKSENGNVELAIRDNGIGLSETRAGSGLGLGIMSHRAKMIGGILTAGRQPEGGTLVVCRLPEQCLEKRKAL